MTDKRHKNIAASIRQRLLNYAHETGRPFQEVLQYFAMERFLYRLSRSPHADIFVLKGALMFTAWGAETSRCTARRSAPDEERYSTSRTRRRH